MSTESEQFDQLRRLLTLKRYEQPPPGYFNNFSRQVIARIESGEHASEYSLLESLLGQSSWLLRAWRSFGTKSILAGAFGVTVCTVLIAGVAFSDRGDLGDIAMSPNSVRESGIVISSPGVPGLIQPIAAAPLQGTGNVQRTSLFQDLSRPSPQLIHMEIVSPLQSN